MDDDRLTVHLLGRRELLATCANKGRRETLTGTTRAQHSSPGLEAW